MEYLLQRQERIRRERERKREEQDDLWRWEQERQSVLEMNRKIDAVQVTTLATERKKEAEIGAQK